MCCSDSPEAPEPTDPRLVINEQARVNRVNQQTPWGQQQWTAPTTPDGQWTVTSTLSPGQEAYRQGLEATNVFGLNLANDRLNALSRTGPAPRQGFAGDAGSINVPGMGPVANQNPTNGSYSPTINQFAPGVAATGQPLSAGGNVGGGNNPNAQFGPQGRTLQEYANDVAMRQSTAGLPGIKTESANLSGLPGVRSGIDFGQVPGMPGNDRIASVNAVRDAMFAQQRDLLEPEFAKADRRFYQDMNNAGLPVGSEAYGEAMGTLKDRQNFALSQAAKDAILAGGAEDSRIFGQQMGLRQQGVGEQMGDAQLGLAARGQLAGEQFQRTGQEYSQSLGARTQLANEMLREKELATGLQVAKENAGAAQFAANASGAAANYRADLANQLGWAQLGLSADGQGWNQAMQAWQMARGGLVQPNFMGTAPIDVTGPYNMYANQQNAAYQGGVSEANANNQAGAGLASAAIMAAAMFSSQSFKTNLAAADNGATLHRLQSLPMYRYEYKREAQVFHGLPAHPRVGPMAEDFHAAFGGEDPQKIELAHAVGVLFSAVKGLAEELRALQQARDDGR